MSMLFMRRVFDSTDKTTETPRPAPTERSIVLITEANQGVGFAIARLLASGDNHHVILASPASEDARVASERLYKDHSLSSRNINTLGLDSTSQQSISAAVEQVRVTYGRLDVLINHTTKYPLPSTAGEMLTSVFATNVTNPLCVTEAFLPLLKQIPKSQIIYWSSEYGSLALASASNARITEVDHVGFVASKAAINMVMVQQAKLFAEDDIKVWAVDPGDVSECVTGDEEQATNAARLVVDVVLGKRNNDCGKVVWAGGTRPW